MADTGGGKIRSRKSQKSRKPYNRQPTRSFLSRASDAVKTFFTPSQWLSRKSATTQSATPSSPHLTVTQPTTSSFIPEPSTSATGTPTYVTPPETPEGEIVMQSSPKRRKRDDIISNHDPFSNIQVTPKVPVTQEQGTSSGKCEDILKLWSNSPKVGTPQSTMASNSPQFNTSFLAPTASRDSSMISTSASDFNRSLLQKRKVQYGGAMSSANRTSAFLSPYRIPNIQKVKVKSSSNRSLTGSERSVADSSMSSTAKKILDTLEKMSTPLGDARKIPSPKQHPGTSFSVMRRKRSLGTSLLGPKSHYSMPPTKGLSTMTPVKVHRSTKIPLDNSLMTRSLLKNATTTESHSAPTPSSTPVVQPSVPQATTAPTPSVGGKMKSHRKTAHYSAAAQQEETPPPISIPDIPFPVATSLPSFNFGRPSSTSTPAVSQSKNKVALNQHGLTSSRPLYNFAAPPVKSTTKDANPEPAPVSSPTFKFCSPGDHDDSKLEGTPKRKNTKPSSESSSLGVKPPPELVAGSVMDVLASKPKGSESSAKPKWDCVTCLLRNDDSKSKCVACDSPKPGNKSATPATTAPLFQQKRKGWECDTCMLNNKEDAVKCVACNSPKPGGQRPPTTNILGQADKWSCPDCLLMNKKELDKCPACNAAKPATKPSSVSTKFGAGMLHDKWECEVCMIRSPQSVTVCPACTTPRPNAPPGSKTQPQTTKPLSFGTTSTSAAKWECPTCMLNNKATALKCVACEAPNPKAAKAPKNPGGTLFSTGTSSTLSPFSKTNNSKTWECETCCVFNPPEESKCVACQSEKPDSGKKSNVQLTFSNTPKVLMSFGTETKASSSKTGEGSSGVTFGASVDSKFSLGNKSTTGNSKVVFGVTPGDKFNLSSGSSGNKFSGFGASASTEKPKLGVSNDKPVTFGTSSNINLKDTKSTQAIKRSNPDSSLPPIKLSSSMAKKWECPTCMLFNTEDKNECVACQTQKPGAAKPSSANQPVSSKPAISFGTPAPALQTKQTTPAPSSSAVAPSTTLGFGAFQTTEKDGAKAPPPPYSFGASGSNLQAKEAPPAAKAAPPPFSFGAGASPKVSLGQKAPESSTKPTSAPFVFGGGPSALKSKDGPPPAKAPASFSFGAASKTPQEQKKSSAPAPFSFGSAAPGFPPKQDAPAIPAQTTAPPAFGTATASLPAAKPGGFTFGSSKSDASLPSASTTAPATIFGAPAAQKPGFSFGSSTQEAAKPVAAGFSFGSGQAGNGKSTPIFGASNPAAPAPSKPPNAGFSFGSAAPQQADSSSTLPKPSFAGFGANTNATPFAGFGKSAPAPAPVAATGGFNFGGKTETTVNTAPAKPAFQFGAGSNSLGQSQGGSSFQFTAGQQGAPRPNAGFSFGASGASSGSGGQLPSFSFGSNSAQPAAPSQPPAPMFGNPAPQAAAPAPGGSMFSIGKSGAASTTPQRTIRKAVRRNRNK